MRISEKGRENTARIGTLLAWGSGAVGGAAFAVLAWLWFGVPGAFDLPHEGSDPYWWIGPLFITFLLSVVLFFIGVMLTWVKREQGG